MGFVRLRLVFLLVKPRGESYSNFLASTDSAVHEMDWGLLNAATVLFASTVPQADFGNYSSLYMNRNIIIKDPSRYFPSIYSCCII